MIRSDSLALDSPASELRRCAAFGKAWLGGETDSASAERDWIAGDTVVAQFAAADSAGTTPTVLTRIEATGSGPSLTVEPQRAPGPVSRRSTTRGATRSSSR